MSDSDCARVLRVKSWATIRGHCSNNARLRSNFQPTPSQHVQCRMAYAWPFFTSSSSSQTSDVGAEMTSIPRRFASATQSGTHVAQLVLALSRYSTHAAWSWRSSSTYNFYGNCGVEV